MTVVCRKEFNAHQDKYLDMAFDDEIYIQRWDCLFFVTRVNGHEKKYKVPDDDLRRAITMDEFLTGVKEIDIIA